MQNMEKSTYWDNPLNRSNISHVGAVCDQLEKSLIILFGSSKYTGSLYTQ